MAPMPYSNGQSCGPLVPGDSTKAPSYKDGPMQHPNLANVELPRIEAQPWVKGLLGWLTEHTSGIARVDLRRPTPPSLEAYEGNLLFANTRTNPMKRGHRGRKGRQEDPDPPLQAQLAAPSVTGARIKVTRNVFFFQDPERKRKPWIDIGAGLAVDMDCQKLIPVARIKIGDLFSIKALPQPCFKFSRAFPLGSTGLSVSCRYELPLRDIVSFYRPPARLMLRLDNMAGSGLHLTPTGIEFDEKLVRFSSNLSARAALGFTFPRSLPIDPADENFGFKIHRLSLKSLW